MQKNLKSFNITTPQYNVLRILRGQKGQPMSAFAIQERMLHRTSNVTRILEKLVEKDLVTRESKSSNRRMIDVMLTAKGAELLRATDEMAHDSHLSICQEPERSRCAANERLAGLYQERKPPGTGNPVIHQTMWTAYIKGFRAFLQLEKSLSRNSVSAYLRDVSMLQEFYEKEFPSLPFDKMALAQLQQFLASIHEKDLAAASQARILSGVKLFSVT